MILLIICIVIIILFIITLLLLPLSVNLTFQYTEKTAHYIFQLYIFKWCVYYKNVPIINKQPNEQSSEFDPLKIMRIPSEIQTTFKRLAVYLRTFRVNCFTWKTDIGMGYADATGLVTGSIWMIKGTLMRWVAQKTSVFPKPIIAVTPYFSENTFQTKLTCIGTIRIGKAINAMIKAKKKEV